MDISPDDYKEYRDLLEGSLAIINKYDKILVQTSNIVLGIPESKLPYPKEAIRLSILTWYKLLRNKNLKEEIIKQDYSELAEYLLSKKFYDSLEIGYIALAKFIPDKEAELCDIYQQSTEKLVREGKKNSDIMNIIIKEMKDLRDLDKILKIQERIVEESRKYLCELRKIEKSNS
jgi:hypothetical protein